MRQLTIQSVGNFRMILVGDVKDKTCIILDDMSDTCGTLCKAAEVLTQNGAKRVIGIVTHGVLSGKGVNEISRFKLGLSVQYSVHLELGCWSAKIEDHQCQCLL